MRKCFMQYFAVVLALAIGSFFGWVYGVPQLIWASDQSHMTSVILVFFVISVGWLGVRSWDENQTPWGWHAANVSMMMGMLGTIVGISLQAKAVSQGLGGLSILGTSLFPTMVGIGSAIILSTLAYNLQSHE